MSLQNPGMMLVNWFLNCLAVKHMHRSINWSCAPQILLLITECDLTTMWKSTHHSHVAGMTHPVWPPLHHSGPVNRDPLPSASHFIIAAIHLPTHNSSTLTALHLWAGLLLLLYWDKECVIGSHLFQSVVWQQWQPEGQELFLHSCTLLCFKYKCHS